MSIRYYVGTTLEERYVVLLYTQHTLLFTFARTTPDTWCALKIHCPFYGLIKPANTATDWRSSERHNTNMCGNTQTKKLLRSSGLYNKSRAHWYEMLAWYSRCELHTHWRLRQRAPHSQRQTQTHAHGGDRARAHRARVITPIAHARFGIRCAYVVVVVVVAERARSTPDDHKLFDQGNLICDEHTL